MQYLKYIAVVIAGFVLIVLVGAQVNKKLEDVSDADTQTG